MYNIIIYLFIKDVHFYSVAPIDIFESSTFGIYDKAIEISNTLSRLNAVISEINVNAVIKYNTNLLPVELNEEIKKLQGKSIVINLLLNAGISLEEIYVVEDVGYSLKDYAILCGLGSDDYKTLDYDKLINNFAYVLLQSTGRTDLPKMPLGSSFGSLNNNLVLKENLETYMQNYYNELNSLPLSDSGEKGRELKLLNRYFEYKTNMSLGIYSKEYNFEFLSSLMEKDKIKSYEVTAMANLYKEVTRTKDKVNIKNVEEYINACYPENISGYDSNTKKYIFRLGRNYDSVVACLERQEIKDSIRNRYIRLLKRIQISSRVFEYIPAYEYEYEEEFKPHMVNKIKWTDEDIIKLESRISPAEADTRIIYTGLEGKLKDSNFITLNDGVNKYFGGNQGWFEGYKKPYGKISPTGCGLIALGNTFLYLSKQNKAYSNDVTETVKGDTKESYMEFIKKLNDRYVSPHYTKITGGYEFNFETKDYDYSLLFKGLSGFELVWGANDYFERNNIGLKAYWNIGEDFLPKAKEMLDNNIPVILCIGPDTRFVDEEHQDKVFIQKANAKKGDGQGVNAYFITLTKIEEKEDGKTILTVSSWGTEYEIDYDELSRYTENKPFGKVVTNILVIERGMPFFIPKDIREK